MSDEQTVNWEAALAEVDARIAKLQTFADGIREMMASGTTGPAPGSGPGRDVQPGAFLKMSIAEATKKHLATQREKQSTQAIMEALVNGGLPPSKYNTVYAGLRRRENQVGDIVNMKGDWGLAEWYPNYRKGNKAKGASNETPEAATA